MISIQVLAVDPIERDRLSVRVGSRLLELDLEGALGGFKPTLGFCYIDAYSPSTPSHRLNHDTIYVIVKLWRVRLELGVGPGGVKLEAEDYCEGHNEDDTDAPSTERIKRRVSLKGQLHRDAKQVLVCDEAADPAE